MNLALAKHDWSLHRKGPADAARHQEKVREAIKGNLGNIIAEESIITSQGDKIVKVPIRSLELPRFRFDRNKGQHVGQGDGDSKVGDVIGRVPSPRKGPGKGPGAGEEPGVDYYEAEITIDELAALLFEDLGLPNLKQKQDEFLASETVRYTDVRKKGITANLDKRRTILENLKRNALAGHAHFGGIKNEDLRYKTWTEEIKRQSNAVVIAMRDVSGSMGEFEKYISRSFYFWMVRFLRTKYQNVEIVFITHHTEAKEVDEDTFFRLGESGGTRVSSAYRLALETIEQRYNPERWNIYPFHFSDGDNWGDSDNRVCLELVNALLLRCNIFGYGEIHQNGYRAPTSLMSVFTSIQDEHFVPVIIADKREVYPALKTFFNIRKEIAA
jgi:sporulation protein YhbH